MYMWVVYVYVYVYVHIQSHFSNASWGSDDLKQYVNHSDLAWGWICSSDPVFYRLTAVGISFSSLPYLKMWAFLFLCSPCHPAHPWFLSKTLCNVPIEHLPNLFSIISIQTRGCPPAQSSCLFSPDSSIPKLSCQKPSEILSMMQCSMSLSLYGTQTIMAQIHPWDVIEELDMSWSYHCW